MYHTHLLIIYVCVLVTTYGNSYAKAQEDDTENMRPHSKLKVCTSNLEEQVICRYLFKKTLKALRDVTSTDLPTILVLCGHRSDVQGCHESYKERLSDVISPYPPVAYTALRENGFDPIFRQFNRSSDFTGVAIIKKSSLYESWADFDNSWSCQAYGNAKENTWLAGVMDDVLQNIRTTLKQCQYSSVFASSITFKVLKTEDPIACLDIGIGDIAFTDVTAAKKAFDSGTFNFSDFEIMCKNGTRMSFDNYQACNLGPSLPKMVDHYNKTQPDKVGMLLRNIKIIISDFERHIWNNDLLCYFLRPLNSTE